MEDITIKCYYTLVTDESYSHDIRFVDFYEENEGKSIFDLTPKLFLEPYQHVPFEKSKIKFMRFVIDDNKGNMISEKYSFWDSGKNQIKEYEEYNNNKIKYQTIVNYVSINDDKFILLRVEKQGDYLNPVSCSIYDENRDMIVKDLL